MFPKDEQNYYFNKSLCIYIMHISVCIKCITLCETEAEMAKAIMKKRQENTICIISELVPSILHAAQRSDL